MKRSDITLIVLYTTITAVLLTYFVLLDNPIFMLCTFLGFVLLAPILASRQSYMSAALLLSLVLIGLSISIHSGWLSFLPHYLPVTQGITLTPVLYTYYGTIIESADTINPIINIGILGYYLFISVIIGLLIVASQDGQRLATHIKKRIGTFRKAIDRKTIKLIALSSGIVILVMPIWPIGICLNKISLVDLPNLNLSVYPTLFSSRYILIHFNSNKYAYLENSNLGNIRFYSGSTPLDISIKANSTYSNTTPILVNLGKSKMDGLITVYFMPFNTSFNPNTKALNEEAFALLATNATSVNYNTSNILEPNDEKLTSIIVVSWVKENASLQFSENITMQHYALQNICAMGNNTVAQLSINGTNLMSVFLIKEVANFSNATIGIEDLNSYSHYLQRFMLNSYAYELNRTNLSFNLTVPDGTCMFYVVVGSANPTNAQIRNVISYTSQKAVTKLYNVPVTMYNQSKKFAFRYGYLTDGILYLGILEQIEFESAT